MDDYQFVSFIWGAAQFTSGNSPVSPKSISDYEKAEQLKDDYHFFACIHYISQVKTGPFAGKYLRIYYKFFIVTTEFKKKTFHSETNTPLIFFFNFSVIVDK